jgi:hypothetical protein
MQIGKTLAILGSTALVGLAPAAPRYEFAFAVASGERVAWGSFEGTDTNKDGTIDKSELTAFKEEVSIYTYPKSKNDWKDGFRPADFPKIVNGLADIRTFSFRAADPKAKTPAFLEFKTRSAKNSEAKGFFFWRSLESAGGGEKLTFFDGVSDGKQGLELNMTERGKGDGLKLSMTYEK